MPIVSLLITCGALYSLSHHIVFHRRLLLDTEHRSKAIFLYLTRAAYLSNDLSDTVLDGDRLSGFKGGSMHLYWPKLLSPLCLLLFSFLFSVSTS